MKKIIIAFTVLLTFFSPLQTINASEEYAPAQVVDKLQELMVGYNYYAIFDTTSSIHVFVSNNQFAEFNGRYRNLVGTIQAGSKVYIYYKETDKWVLGSAGYTGTENGINYHYYESLTLKYNNHDIYNSDTNQLSFPKAPAVTPAYLREQATVGAIQEVGEKMPAIFGMILPIGLVVLSALLVIALVKRLKRSAGH